MLIHFTASHSKVLENIRLLRQIVDIVKTSGHTLCQEWVEPAYSMQTSRGELNSRAAEESFDAVRRADVVIIEGSAPSIGLGYQMAMALDMKKPVLLLMQQGITEPAFIASFSHELLTKTTYTESTLQTCINEFLRSNEISNKELRFNFVIDRQLYNHIRWKSHKTRKTKAEIVRELLLDDLERGL